ncbi:hypothetical protein CF15_02600 [Pyrodictium occultum]|uniref:Uncharacterized protein n=1 Tax=Pyrodictium occultum TaxID=2309 RepID=A0A0V8RUI0_PYROC|nr:hypothetical protein CF15_02600 [Pyrodictium occultum]
MKREARLLYIQQCGDAAAAAVLRGQGRVEALFIGGSLEELVETVRSSSFFEELRAAWPPGAAARLGLEPLSLESYTPSCHACIKALLRGLCAEDPLRRWLQGRGEDAGGWQRRA